MPRRCSWCLWTSLPECTLQGAIHSQVHDDHGDAIHSHHNSPVHARDNYAAQKFCHGMDKKNHKDFDRHVPKLVGSFWCILVTIYLYISEMSLRAFNCQTSGAKGTTLVLVASGEIVCWTSREHAQIVLMATANIVLIVVGIPLFWGWFLRKNVVRIFEDQHLRIIGLGGRRDQNVHHGFRKAYGVIYNKFKPAFYYWRLVVCS